MWFEKWFFEGKRLLKFIGIYIFIVVLFATINWLVFNINTTSFLIPEQLNKYVGQHEYLNPEIDLAAYHRNAKDNMPITIDGFSAMMKPTFERLEATNDSLSFNQHRLNACIQEWESLSRIASAMRYDSVKLLKERMLSGYQKKIDSLRRFLEGKDSTRMIIEGKYVEMAQLQYEYAKGNAEIQSMIGQYIGNFIPDNLSRQIRKCNEDYLEITIEIQELEQQRRDVSSRIRNLIVDFHENRRDAVGFLDFLYYSICVSTTVSFGDIAPNSGLTRVIAIIELLFCIIIVGIIANRIINSREKKRNLDYDCH